MKKFFLSLLLGGVALTAAADNDYMVFQKTNGEEFSLNVDHLKITFADGAMNATDGKNSFSVALSDMNKMFFSANPTMGIEQATTATSDEVSATIENGQLHVTAPVGSRVSVYSLDGRQVGTRYLAEGTYLVRINNTTLKVLAR